mmetsp:Transcript_3553/g.11019  ORF Transcript_3553/g.11019 Transcript_3553/m.11019 type:complete len:85 (+) Transcript_3553:639-893(+)
MRTSTAVLAVGAATTTALQPLLRPPRVVRSLVPRSGVDPSKESIDIKPKPRDMEEGESLGLSVLAPPVALFILVAIVSQFATPV